MTRVAVLTPLPPARTGIAHYASMLLPALRERVEVGAFDSLDGYDRAAYDAVYYQLGNNPHHEWIYREAMEHPGIVVLHDVVLHHLIVEMTLARGDADGYVEALRASHGEVGAAWARGRAAGLHHELANFLLPASIELARRSRAVIVHNRWAADVLRSYGVVASVVPHPYVPSVAGGSQPPGSPRTIGLFGFLTSAKRADIVLAAFASARSRMPSLRLLVVGEPAPNIDVAALQSEGVEFTGYVEDFDRYYGLVDRLVNLRYPSAGETSGTLIRAFDAGKPVAVSDYAQFAEYPDSCVVKIPFGVEEVESLADFFLRDLDEASIASAQRAWLEENARIDLTVDGYLAPLLGGLRAHPHREGLPLFPSLEVVSRNGTTITLRNTGDFTIRTRTYGEPAYRIIAKLYEGNKEIADHWLDLPRDLEPGQTTTIEIPYSLLATRYSLTHALQSIPVVEDPFHAAAL